MENGKYPVRASNIAVKVDGKAASGAAVMSGSTMTITTGTLSAGTHTVTADVSDDAGNRTRVCATVTAGSASNVFADTASHWANGYASLLSARGIMKGETANGSTYFRPNRNLTRQEFAVTMARLLNLDTSSTSGTLGFADEDSIPSWARGAVAAVSRANIMNGSSSNGKLYFNPQATMTRTEVMTVIGRCLPRGYAAVSLNYTDASVIPSWATEQVKTCVSAGVIGGYSDGTIDRTAISPAVRLRKFWLCSDSCRATAVLQQKHPSRNLDGCFLMPFQFSSEAASQSADRPQPASASRSRVRSAAVPAAAATRPESGMPRQCSAPQ